MAAIARIGTDEAAEFLLDVMRSQVGRMGERARHLLERHAQERMIAALERNRRSEPDPALKLFISQLLGRIRQGRNVRSGA